MKRKGWIILTCVCAALLLWACSALVEGPTLLVPVEKADIPAAEEPRLARAEALPAEMAHTARADEAVIRRGVLHQEDQDADAACVQVSDGNGYPITGRTYVRTVYTACPLEDMPG